MVKIYANSKYLDRDVQWVLFILAEYIFTIINIIYDMYMEFYLVFVLLTVSFKRETILQYVIDMCM